MASTFSSQQAMHALFLFIPLNFSLLLIPNTSVTKYNKVCDYFKKGENVKKGTSQDNLHALSQYTGLCKVNDNVLYKEKFSSVLSGCHMSNNIVKSRLPQASICFYTTTLHAHKLLSNKHRKGDSSIIAVPLEWDFESECHSDMRK